MFFIKKDDAILFSHVIMVLRMRDLAHKARETLGMEVGDGASASPGAPHHEVISREHPDLRGKAPAVKHDVGKYRHARWMSLQSGFPFERRVVFPEDIQFRVAPCWLYQLQSEQQSKENRSQR